MDFCPNCGSMIIMGSVCPNCHTDINSFNFQKLKIGVPNKYILNKNALRNDYNDFLELITNKDEIEFTKDEIMQYFNEIVEIANNNFIQYEKKVLFKEFSNELDSYDNFINDQKRLYFKSKFKRDYFNYFVELK